MAEIMKISNECAALHNLSVEQIEQIYAVQDFTSFKPSEDMKCFLKCNGDNNGIVEAGKVSIDRLVVIAQLFGKDEAAIRAKFEKCNPLHNKGTNDCDEHWNMNACMNSA